MSDYGDMYSMCQTDDQKDAYVRGFNDARAGQDNINDIAPALHEYYGYGQADAAG